MKNTTPQQPAFSLESLQEFLDGYRGTSTIKEKNYLEILKDNGGFIFSNSYFDTLETAESELNKLFEFLSPGDESVQADWILHVERWEFANEFPDYVQAESGDEREETTGQAAVEDFGPDL